MQQKIIQKSASGIPSKALTRTHTGFLPVVNSSEYQAWVEIPVEGVVEQTSYVSNVAKNKPGADDSRPEAEKGPTWELSE